MKDPNDDFLSSVLIEIESVFTKAGVDSHKARTAVQAVEEKIRKLFGGDRHYVSAPGKKKRNRQIIADWRAKIPKEEIARKQDVCVATVNRVINRYLQNVTKKKHQAGGFGSDDWVL